MCDLQNTYQKLLDKNKRAAMLGSVGAVLGWDEETYMPPGATAHRAEQSAFMAGLHHQWAVDREIGALLLALEESLKKWDEMSVEAVNIRMWRRDYDLETKLPKELVEEMSRVKVLARDAWVNARQTKDFAVFHPWLERTIELKRQEAECYGYKKEPYDALLDVYEPGMTAAQVAPVLEKLRAHLVPLLQAIADAPRKPDVSILQREYPVSAQEAFAKEVAAAIGYDFNRGRLDVVQHPFCTELGPDDVRITTRYDERFFNSAFFGVVHEAGHGIYEQNLPGEHWGTPMGTSVSLGIHESQSRLWENFVARSHAFWEYWYPTAQKYFTALADVSLDDFVSAINEARPSLIRVEADEATYNLHILLRFELERALLSGDLDSADVPEAWNETFSEYFGMDVPDDSAGCLQDVHWSFGLLGYFPTYSLGNLNAAQLFEKATQDIGDLEELIRKGEYEPLRSWLTKNIHSQARKYSPAKLIEVATGKPMDESALTGYLEKKFGQLYGI